VSGQPIDDVARAIAGAPVWSIGLNCGAGIGALSAPLDTLASHCDCRVSCAPAAGLPNAFGEYDELASLPSFLLDVAVAGLVDIVGGCCGTTPAVIAEIAGAVEGLPARMAGFRE
jgi:5-methyltetrahydrofolate--homocysteine methyltransferase